MESGWPLMTVVVVLFVLVAGALAVLKKKGEKEESGTEVAEAEVLPYRKREWILDHGSEKEFYAVLEKASQQVLGPCRVMVQVQLSRLIEVVPGTERPARWRNMIDRKSVDYVVCDAGSLKPRFAVELDGSSHDSAKRQERDRFVERALEGAGVKLLRVDRRGKVGVEEVVVMVKGAIATTR